MRTGSLLTVTALVGVALLASGPALAGGRETGEKAGASPEQQDIMAAFAKYAQPGEHHAHLAKLAGTWDAVVKNWTGGPDAEPTVSRGTAVQKLALGGRFLQTTFTGEYMGQKFEGIGISGYDNLKRKHTDIWIDSMGTFMYPSEGTCEEDGKVLRMSGSYINPATGSEETMRSITRIISDDKYVVEMFATTPDGKEFKNLEIVYTRRKGA
ncbi:MAG: DUF1579 domain-containing protein [Acidobacteriota bacterium]